MVDIKGKMAEERATQKWNDATVKVMQAAYLDKLTTCLALETVTPSSLQC